MLEGERGPGGVPTCVRVGEGGPDLPCQGRDCCARKFVEMVPVLSVWRQRLSGLEPDPVLSVATSSERAVPTGAREGASGHGHPTSTLVGWVTPPLLAVFPLGWKSPTLLSGAGRGRVPPHVPGEGGAFRQRPECRNSHWGHHGWAPAVPSCCLLPAVSMGCGFLGLGKGLGQGWGAKVHPTSANTPACRVWRGPGAIWALGGLGVAPIWSKGGPKYWCPP